MILSFHYECLSDAMSAIRVRDAMSAPQVRDAISECLSDIKSDSFEVQRTALQTLASITRVSPHNRNLLAHTQGAVSTLLCLTKTPTMIQTLALSTLFNLSLNPDLKRTLTDIETIRHLNAVIQSTTSADSIRVACSLVCSLAMLDKNKAKFGVAGTVQVLVHAVAGSCNPASHHILSSLAELVQFHGNCTLAVRAGAVQALLGVVESADGDDLAVTSLAVLCLVARFDEGLNALVRSDRVVALMVGVLKGRCMVSKEGAADILLRLFDESEGCVRNACRISELSAMLADLSVRGSSRARDRAAQIMKKMEANVDPQVDGSSLSLQCKHNELYNSSAIGSGSRNTPAFEFGRTYVVRPKGKHQATIVWLHGFGDNGSSWSQMLDTLPLPNIKWICPTAPTRPVALFGGFPCAAWFDVGDIAEDAPEDLESLDASAAHVANLLSAEPADIKLGVGGFSMGAAIALYSATCHISRRYGNGNVYAVSLSAVVCLSGWLPCARSLRSRMERSQEAASLAASLPTLLCHGKGDDVVAYAHGEKSAQTLRAAGFRNLTFRTYNGLGHYTIPEETDDVSEWLTAQLLLDGSR